MIHTKIPVGLISLLLLIVMACSLSPPAGPSGPTRTPASTSTPRPTETPLPPKPIVPYTPVPADALSPNVIWRSPQRGESLAPDGAIELTFDKPMDRDAVQSALRVQLAGAETALEGELSWLDERTARFKPAKALARAAAYDVILTQDATAASGEPLREPLSFRFSTAGYLEAAQVVPDAGATDVETDATITVFFNRPVAPLTSLQQMEELPDPLTFSPVISGAGEWLNTSIYVFRPDEPLAGGVTYQATVAAGLEDVSGAVLAEDYVWQFTTVPPRISWTRPRSDETLVDINTAIEVQFNQLIDSASAQAAFTLSKGGLGSSRVRGAFRMEGPTLVFTPTRPLEFDTTYTAEMAAGVKSAASGAGGEGMVESYTWTFTTVPLPEIVATTPADGERDAPPHTGFQIHFNTRIDPKTVMPNLNMTPPLSPTQVYTYWSPYNNTFHIEFGAQPATDYTVRIDDGIADPYGNTIRRGRTVRFRTGPLEPVYRLVVPDTVGTYDAALPAQLVLGHINVNRVNFQLYRLPHSVLADEDWYWRREELPADAELLREWRESLESPQNQQRYTAIDLTETPGGTLAPGVYLVESDSPDVAPDRHYYNPRHILVVSDLNLTLKAGPDQALVWATDLATGEPVADLTLAVNEMRRGEIGRVTTDVDGVARLELNRDRGTIIVASASPFVAVADGWGRGISPWDFGVGQGVGEQEIRMYITTDRPIYRPDQTVNFKGVIRAEDDAEFRLPGGGQALVVIRDAAYEEIYNERLPLSELGTFDGSVELEAGASLGQYRIEITYNDTYAQATFMVAAYRPPEFEVVVETERDEVQRGDDVAATMAARYYFGGPLAETEVQWNVLAERYTFEPPWGGRYSFDDVDDPYVCYRCWWWEPPTPPKPILSGSGATDANGELTITLDGAELDQALEEHDLHAARITIEATATGPDNQPISGRTNALVHPGPYYIGLSPQQYVSNAGEESAIDLAAVDWAGERLSDKELRVQFYRREWINTFIENDLGGGRWSWETEEELVDEITVATDELGEAVATFVPPEGGSYHIVATPASPLGGGTEGGIRSSIFIWVAGEDYVSWRRENHDRITLVSDKTTYNVGETAEILIPSPFEAPHYALVTIERADIRRHEVIRLATNSHIYRLPITEGDVPNIYVSVVLIQGRAATSPQSPPDAGGDVTRLADFKMGLLPLDVTLDTVTLNVQLEAEAEQAQPGEEVAYTVTARQPNGEPAAGAELSLDVVDKAVLSLRPRTDDIVLGFYARRSLHINTASGLSLSVNRYLEEVAEDLGIELQQDEAAFGMADGAVAEEAEEMPAAAPMATQTVEKTTEADVGGRAANIAPPEGVEIREEFQDTAYWEPRLVTDREGKARVTLTLPDNLTTWVVRGVGLTAQTAVGEATDELVATKPLLVRPVAPRFFVVEDRAQLAANVSNNTDTTLEVEVSLSAEGVGISADTPPRQTVTLPARSERKVTWWATVDDVTEAQLVFSAVTPPDAGGEVQYADASTPRVTTGPDGSLLVLRYTTPDIVGTAGQLTEGGSRTEAVALPPVYDERQGNLTVQMDPSLAAGMQDGLDYLEHYEYECTEQTVSRFLPNLLTYRALTSLGLENPELAKKLPALVDEGLKKLYNQQNPDGGWGWWPTPLASSRSGGTSNAHVSAYVVFGLLKAQESGWEVRQEVLQQGLAYLQSELKTIEDYVNFRDANRQAWLLYVLAEAEQAPAGKLDALYENRQKLSYYARAYLAQALWLADPADSRLDALLSDLNNAAILSATGAHWEEANYSWWAMNTDTRSTAIILDTYTKLDPDNALVPNIVRWLMIARKTGIWETTQETAWALIALTDWMVHTGELDADYDFAAYLNDEEIATGAATPETIRESVREVVPISELAADMANALTIARSDGPGRLYYTAHLEVYQPVENVEPADRGFSVQRRYTLASCDAERRIDCPEVREVKLGDVIRVDLTLVTPHDRYYVVVEDPLPAGGEAIDTGLATTSLLAMDPTLRREDSRYWWWWHWYSRSELRDEKVVLFADYLSAGAYEYSYTFRATLPGDYHVIPTVAQEFYFPEVFGRSGGRLLTIGE